MITKITDKGCDNLRLAIIERGANDYLEVKKELHEMMFKGNRSYGKLIDELNSLIKFFKSDWYDQLCSIESDIIIKGLDAKFEAWVEDPENNNLKVSISI